MPYTPLLLPLEPRVLLSSTPTFLKDINTAPAGLTLDLAAGSAIFFTTGSNTAPVLMASSGTFKDARTVLASGAGLSNFLTLNNTAYFFQTSGTAVTLFTSNSTAAGTVAVKAFTTTNLGSGKITTATVGRILYFSSTTAAAGSGATATPASTNLYRSDGTAAGTILLHTFSGVADAPADFTSFDGDTYFSFHGAVWRTDNSASGTKQITTPADTTTLLPLDLAALGNRLFFISHTASGAEIFSTDGHHPATQLTHVSTSTGGSGGVTGLAETNATLIFGVDNGSASTVQRFTNNQVSTLATLPDNTSASSFVRIGNTVYFTVGQDLWSSDGETASLLHAGPFTGPFDFKGDAVFASDFSTSPALFKSSGTAGRTTRVHSISRSLSSTPPQVFHDMLLFTDAAGVNQTDGTNDNTHPQQIAAAVPQTLGSEDSALFTSNDLVFFSAADPAHGPELWRSDGSKSGTFLLGDLNPGSGPSSPAGFATIGQSIFFSAFDGQHREIFRTDGSAKNTTELAPLPTGIEAVASTAGGSPGVAFNGAYYFSGSDNGVYRLDPATSTVTRLGDGYISSIGNPVFNNRLYFEGFDSHNGYQIWSTDGTAANTARLATVQSRQTANTPIDYAQTSDHLFFMRRTNAQVWTTDGTSANTVRLFDPSGSSTSVHDLTNFQGTIYFAVHNPPSRSSPSLFSTGADPATTASVAGAGLPVGQEPGDLTVAGNHLVFTLGNSTRTDSSTSLWSYNGLAASQIAAAKSQPSGLVAAGEQIFFSANLDASGQELWVTGGSAASNLRLSDINKSSASSSPVPLGLAGSTLVFSADDGTHGQEPFSISRHFATSADITQTFSLKPPKALLGGAALPLSFRVTNHSKLAALSAIPIEILLTPTSGSAPATLLAAPEVPAQLSARRSKNVSVPVTLPLATPAGTYRLTLLREGSLIGTSVPFTVSAAVVNLALTAVTPIKLAANKTGTAILTVANTGNVPLTENVTVTLVSGTTTIGPLSLAIALPAGKRKSFSLALPATTLAKGSHPVSVTLGPDPAFGDSNSADNTVSTTLTIT